MIRPLRDRLVIEPLDEPLSSILHVVCERNHHRGRVLEVGPSVKFNDRFRPRAPHDTQVGDIVQFTDVMRFPVIMDHGAKRLIIQEADVLFIEQLEDVAA